MRGGLGVPSWEGGQESDPAAEGLFPPLQVGKQLAGWLPAFMGLCGVLPLHAFCSCVSLRFWLSQLCSFLLMKVSLPVLGERAEEVSTEDQASLVICPEEAQVH